MIKKMAAPEIPFLTITSGEYITEQVLKAESRSYHHKMKKARK